MIIRVAFSYQHQEVTGICVNDTQMHVDRQYIKNLKMQIYYCKKYGVQSHLDHIQCKKRFYKEHMYGKAYFVNMVDNETGQYLLKQLDEINWES